MPKTNQKEACLLHKQSLKWSSICFKLSLRTKQPRNISFMLEKKGWNVSKQACDNSNQQTPIILGKCALQKCSFPTGTTPGTP
jgi:hypothetical protein